MLDMTGLATLMDIADKNDRRRRTEDEFYARYGRGWLRAGRITTALGFLARMPSLASMKMPGAKPGNHETDVGRDQAALPMDKLRPAGASLNCSTSVISVSA